MAVGFGGGLEHHERVTVAATHATVTDRSFPESKEYVGRFGVVDVTSHDEASKPKCTQLTSSTCG